MKKNFMLVLLGVLCMVFLCGCEPPISVTWRQSLLDPSTRVMQVTNRDGSETLVIKLKVKNKNQTEASSHVFKVGPGETEEIGILEMGWTFKPGDTYSLEADDYLLPVEGTVP